MKENARKTKWLPDVLTALGGPGIEHESLLDLLTYIGQNDEYKVTWEAAAKMNGLVLPTLDGVATKAVQSMCNMNKSQMKQLRSCLKAELGSTVFSTEYKIQQVLGLEQKGPSDANVVRQAAKKQRQMDARAKVLWLSQHQRVG
jgi:hypothetical protein